MKKYNSKTHKKLVNIMIKDIIKSYDEPENFYEFLYDQVDDMIPQIPDVPGSNDHLFDAREKKVDRLANLVVRDVTRRLKKALYKLK